MNFPVQSFLQIKDNIILNVRELEKEKADLTAVRMRLDETRRNILDEQFKVEFERLGALSQDAPSNELQHTFQLLQELVQQGATAGLLGNDELGPFNLAMFIQNICKVTSAPGLEMAAIIVRLTIIAGADLQLQKAYVGNGGATCLEWICLYLAGGISDKGYLHTPDQLICCYTIFPWLIDNEKQVDFKPGGFQPFMTFLAGLKETTAEAAALQEKILLRMMAHGFAPFLLDHHWVSAAYFSRIAAINVQWLCMLFPFETNDMKPYADVVQKNIDGTMVEYILNGFTSSNKARKAFKAFFSPKPHWLLKYIVTSVPDIVFSLVKRNEQDMLLPFIENFKAAIIDLRDQDGNTLLHHAVLSRGVVDFTFALLARAGLSPEAVNKEGHTPLTLALKNNRTDILKWLQ